VEIYFHYPNTSCRGAQLRTAWGQLYITLPYLVLLYFSDDGCQLEELSEGDLLLVRCRVSLEK